MKTSLQIRINEMPSVETSPRKQPPVKYIVGLPKKYQRKQVVRDSVGYLRCNEKYSMYHKSVLKLAKSGSSNHNGHAQGARLSTRAKQTSSQD